MEPLEEVSPEVIRSFIKQQTCWLCGKGVWKALSQHLVKKHKLLAAEVREMAYMLKRERLISDELSERLSQTALIKFGKRRHIPQKGESQPGRNLSKKAKDILGKRIKVIRPLAAIAQGKRKKPHACKVCGKLIEASRPIHCSPECKHIAWSNAAKESMTPERIAFFNTIRRKPTSEQCSRAGKKAWEKIRSWPVEKQQQLFSQRAASRKSPLVSVPCVMCGVEFTIPIYRLNGKRRKTCSSACSKALTAKNGRERPIKDSTRAKMSQLARERHITIRQFGRFK